MTAYDDLALLYGNDCARELLPLFGPVAGSAASSASGEGGMIVGLYPGQLSSVADGESALESTLTLVERCFAPLRPFVHVLPPYVTADEDRFEIIDDAAVDPRLGTWDDLARHRSRNVLDVVLNQRSTLSAEFATTGVEGSSFRDFFTTISDGFDFSAVTISRGTLPVEGVQAGDGRRYWCSRSATQVDLNYRNPAVLRWTLGRLERLREVAEVVRLDGLAYVWKASGTSCANLPEARAIGRLLSSAWRDRLGGSFVLAEVDAYAGDDSYRGPTGGPDYVYDFGLPAALVAALLTADTEPLIAVLDAAVERRGGTVSVAMTHDGITLRPWSPVIPRPTLDTLVRKAEAGALEVVRAPSPGRAQAEYEIDELLGELGPDAVATANSMVMAAPGLPYFYLPGALGLRDGGRREASGRERVRGSWDMDGNGEAVSARRFADLRALATIRGAMYAAGWLETCRVVDAPAGVVALRFGSGHGVVEALHNFGPASVPLPLHAGWHDLLRAGEPAPGWLEPRRPAWLADPEAWRALISPVDAA